MNFVGLICLIIAQFITGYGILRLLKVDTPPIASFLLSLVTGVVIISLAPCLLQLMHIPISKTNDAIAIAALTGLLGIPAAMHLRKPQGNIIEWPGLYELPFFIVLAFMIITSVWRCYYFPATPRDVLAGAELLAEYTVREHNMVNSVYSVDLHTTNNQYKSPFLTSMQIVFKQFVSPFGKVWLSTLFVPFTLWVYSILKKRLHGLLAGIVMLMFLTTPDLFAYTYIILYDYSAMVYFFVGFYFLMQYLINKKNPDLLFAALMFGFSTYVRVETLVLVAMFTPLLVYNFYFKEKIPLKKSLISSGILMAAPVFFYILCMNVFVPAFVPTRMDTAGQINSNLLDISAFFERIYLINRDVIFAKKGILVFGYFMYIFLAFLLVDLIFIRKFSKRARITLYGVAVVYFGLAFLGYLLPLFDVLNTSKRGLFKAIPIMTLYMANSGFLQRISDYLIKKETTDTTTKPTPVTKQLHAKKRR